MKTSHLFAAVALASLAAAGAQAETYEGVHAPVSAASRADVEAQAVAAAHAKDQNVVRGSRGAETVAVSRDRAGVEAEALEAAAAPHQNVVAGSRVNSKVVPTMPNPVQVRAEAAKQSGSKL
jgi:hypothetical protein